MSLPRANILLLVFICDSSVFVVVDFLDLFSMLFESHSYREREREKGLSQMTVLT